MSALAPPDAARAARTAPSPPPAERGAPASASDAAPGSVIPSHLPGDVAGGLVAAGWNLAVALALGLLAFAPLGPEYYEIGLYAGFATAIWGHLIAGLLGGAAHPGSGPRAAAWRALAASGRFDSRSQDEARAAGRE